MSDETRRVLDMVAAGTITAEEGQRLLAALDSAPPALPPAQTARPAPRFLKVEAGGVGKDGKDGKDEGFRMRIPLDLLRAGIKIRALIPEARRDRINERLREKGIEDDIFEMSDAQLDSLIHTLGELELEAADSNGSVRLYLE